jgi:hypothetical protein
MVDRRGRQKGAQEHAEGQHGKKTHAHLVDQLHGRSSSESLEEHVEGKRREGAEEGRRRLVEDRQQHDEAEKNSERNRLAIEHERQRDEGPSDNTGSLHGPIGQRELRADNKSPGHRPSKQ